MEQLLSTDPKILLLLLAWSLPWKGVALWKAARRNDTRWFVVILLLNTLALLEIIYLFYVIRRVPTSSSLEVVESGSQDWGSANHKHDDEVEDSVDEWLIKKAEKKNTLRDAFLKGEVLSVQDTEKILELPENAAAHIIEELIEEGRIIRTEHGFAISKDSESF